MTSKCWKVSDANISSIRAGFCGAASLPLVVGARFRQITGVDLYAVSWV